jgi:hypothetical protein
MDGTIQRARPRERIWRGRARRQEGQQAPKRATGAARRKETAGRAPDRADGEATGQQPRWTNRQPREQLL